jgi:hypothetical protein
LLTVVLPCIASNISIKSSVAMTLAGKIVLP